MKKFMKIAAVGAGMAAIVAGASPASAQGYPYGYNNNGSGVVGAIINSVTGGGYGQYPMGNYGYARTDTRTSVSQCVAAVERGRSGYGQGYNQGYGYQGQGYQGQGYQGQGYQGQGYGNQRYGGGLRVVGITNVERRSNGGLRISGIVQSGANEYGQGGGRPPHNGNNGYNQGYANPAYNNGYGNNGYNQGYGNQAYNNGFGGNGYANNGYAAQVQSRFSCKVDARGVVTNVRVDQGSGYRRGY